MSNAVLDTPPARFIAPEDASQFAEQDAEYVHGFVRRHLGSTVHNAEDVAQHILKRLVEREVWTFYDAKKVSDFTKRPVTWRSFLSSVVLSYLRGRRESLATLASHEVAICDAPAGDGSSSWIELHGGSRWDDYSELFDEEFVARMRNYLALQGGWGGGPTLLSMFDLLYARIKDGESLTRKSVQEHFGVSSSAASARIGHLYDAMKTGVAAPPVKSKFDIGGYLLTAAQVRACADALRAAGGNRVAPALAAIGSPLAHCDTKWFIRLGRGEIRAHPECRVPKGSHKDGHSSATKLALIHLFERLLAEASGEVPPAPEPEPEIKPSEELECELWKLGLNKDQVLAVTEAADRIYRDE